MAISSNSALGAESLISLIVKSLPPKASDESSPVVKSPYAAIALLAHACMLAVGFRLVGLGEDHRIDATSEPGDVRSLPPEWDATPTYAFRYAHAQSSMEYLLKISRLGGKALVYATALPDDKTASFEIKAQDYTSDGAIRESSSISDINSAVKNVFISEGRMNDLSSLFKINIIQKLAPGIRKEGYEETSTTTQQPRGREEMRTPARPFILADPHTAPRGRPVPPGDFPPPNFEDEYQMNGPPRVYPGYVRSGPLSIGERDLYPPGLRPHDPLRIGYGGGGFGGGGGMHPAPDDPLFTGQGGVRPYDHRAPPGARYDPIGPGDGPPNLRGSPRFREGRGGGGMGSNPFGGFGSVDFI